MDCHDYPTYYDIHVYLPKDKQEIAYDLLRTNIDHKIAINANYTS